MKTEAISCEPSAISLENRGYERCLLIVILNECEGFAAVMENTVKCHPERQRRIYYRSEEDGKTS